MHLPFHGADECMACFFALFHKAHFIEFLWVHLRDRKIHPHAMNRFGGHDFSFADLSFPRSSVQFRLRCHHYRSPAMKSNPWESTKLAPSGRLVHICLVKNDVHFPTGKMGEEDFLAWLTPQPKEEKEGVSEETEDHEGQLRGGGGGGTGS
jgi:hypothetical protein